MQLRVLFAALAILGFVAEIGLLAVLLARRWYKDFPVFTIYIAFNVFTDLGVGMILAGATNSLATGVAVTLLPPQYFLEIMVLCEIAWHVLRPVQMSLPRRVWQGFALALAGTVVCGGLMAWYVARTGSPIYGRLKGPFDLTIGMLRMLIFVVIAGFAQLLGIGWKNKVLQIASALSFYSAVALIVSVVQSHSGPSPLLEKVRAANYTFELCFLVWTFTTKEVRRGEFSPQMEQFLVTLAGRARLARTALVRTQVK